MTALPAKLALALAIFALVAPGTARAQSEYAREGAYLGLAGSLGIYTELEDELNGDVDVDTPVGLNARAGYRLHPHAAVEGEFEWLPEADVEINGNTIGDIQSFTFGVNGKGFILTGRAQPFLMIGLNGMVLDGSGSTEAGFAARFGGGIDLYVTRNFYAAFDTSYVLPTGDIDDFDYVSIGWGIGYRF